MSEDTKPEVDKSSPAFREGFEAALNCPEEIKNWKAGNDLGKELKRQVNTGPMDESLLKEFPTPLFMRDNPEGNKGTAQDVKDETEE